MEQKTHSAGRWIRLERQRRYQKANEKSVAVMATMRPDKLFISGLDALAGKKTPIGDLSLESWERLIFEAVGRKDIIAPRDGKTFEFKPSHASRLVGEGRAVMTLGDEWFEQTGQARGRLVAQKWLEAIGTSWPVPRCAATRRQAKTMACQVTLEELLGYCLCTLAGPAT